MIKKLVLFTWIIFWVFSGFGQTNYAIIKGSLQSLSDGDSVILKISRIGDPFNGEYSLYATALRNRTYFVKIPVGKLPLHMTITYVERKGDVRFSNKLNKLALTDYYLEAGDILRITEKNEKYKFKGKGSEKFQVLYALNNLQDKYYQGVTWGEPLQTALYFQKHDSLLIERLHLLSLVRYRMTARTFHLINADMLGNYLSRYDFVNSMLPESQIKEAVKNLSDYTSIVPKRYLYIKCANTKRLVKLSSAYTLGLLIKYKFDSCAVAGKPYKLANSYSYFNRMYSGELRERLILNAIYLDKDNEDLRLYVDHALDLTTVPEFRSVLIKLKRTRLAGALAFNFNLPDTTGNMRSLSDFKGKIVLLDFWFTGCGSCSLSAPFLEKVEERFIGKPVVFITISFDKTRNLWLESIRSKTYTSEHTINLFTEGKGFNHPLISRYSIDGCPTLILIDRNGRLMINPENPRFDDGAQITATIENELKKMMY